MNKTNQYRLDNSGIERSIEELIMQLQGIKIERRKILRIRLSVEEALLRFRDHFGETMFFTLCLKSSLFRVRISLEIDGKPFNPMYRSKSALQKWTDLLMASAELSPIYNYSDGKIYYP